jgi:hypothetical protein
LANSADGCDTEVNKLQQKINGPTVTKAFESGGVASTDLKNQQTFSSLVLNHHH